MNPSRERGVAFVVASQLADPGFRASLAALGAAHLDQDIVIAAGTDAFAAVCRRLVRRSRPPALVAYTDREMIHFVVIGGDDIAGVAVTPDNRPIAAVYDTIRQPGAGASTIPPQRRATIPLNPVRPNPP